MDTRSRRYVGPSATFGHSPYNSQFVDSIVIMRYRAVSGSGVTSRTSNEVELATPLQQSTTLVTGLSQSSVPRVHTLDVTCPQDGRMHPRIKRMYIPFPFSHAQPSLTIHRRWLYSLFLAIDANFRLKLKARDIKDPELGPGLAYFANPEKFEAHIKHRADENDVRIFDLFCCRTEDLRSTRSRPVGRSSMQ